MAGIASEDAGMGRSVEGSSEALAEWRSSEQVENGIPSTSPPYWDTDDDDDGGLKPSELYGKYTWKIEKFSQINKRELRSNAFEVGGYKWYILIYPQGCDVCNHLSLFLCVANHDKLLPGWSHFAQFTIAVVNKDPKKSKYSDTLHRFWKKEHDWGWKKFMELSKVSDGFLDAADTLIIKAQVQVIREKADRPFRCLDCQYRRELVRVYLTNVEQICRRFVEERRGKLGRLIEDKDMWSSFRDFWVGMDRNTRRSMSREKSNVILKVVVKHFFIEKEVTSTLVMDSLYSGLKALESQSKSKKGRAKLLDSEEIPAPIICVEKDTFVLVDDVLHLIERAAMEPLPPKDEKGPQNRTKDGNLGEELNKDSIERDERRLTELGRRTVEIFILAHIFNNKIEVAYQEAVALKRQEELIREEEMAAWQESDQKCKRGMVEKEKKAKKKQGKQKRNNKKGKDKGKEDRSVTAVLVKQEEENPGDDIKDSLVDEMQAAEEKSDMPEDASDMSDSVDGGAEVLQPDSEDRDASPVNWDIDTSEAHPPTETNSTGASTLPYGTSEKRGTSVMDDSSSTCSTDSVRSTVMNSPYRGSSNYQWERSPSRGKSQRGKATCNGTWDADIDNQPSGATENGGDRVEGTASSKVNDCDIEFVALHDRTTHIERLVKKDEEVIVLQSRPITKVPIDEGPPIKEKMIPPPSPQSSQPSLSATTQLKPEIKIAANGDTSHVRKASPGNSTQADKAATSVISVQSTSVTKSEVHNGSALKIPERPAIHQGTVSSRPSSAPVIPGPRPVVAPVVSMVQAAPLLARSVSAVGRLGPDPSPATHSYAPQSYRNAITGNSIGSNSSAFPHSNHASSGVNQLLTTAHSSALVSAPMFLPIKSDRADPTSFRYGMVNRDSLYNRPQWMDSSQKDDNRTMLSDPSPSVMNGFQNFELCTPFNSSRPREKFSMQTPSSSSSRQSQGVATDDFPHLDIINDLLDDEYGGLRSASGEGGFSQPYSNGPQFLNRQFSMPCDSGVSGDLGSSTSSSCRFERTRSSLDCGGLQRGYGQYDTLREFVPQVAPLTYTNGHMDGMIPSHWQMAGSDVLVGMMNPDGETSPYYGPDYSSLACDTSPFYGPDYSSLDCDVNGYPYYQPSNGH